MHCLLPKKQKHFVSTIINAVLIFFITESGTLENICGENDDALLDSDDFMANIAVSE